MKRKSHHATVPSDIPVLRRPGEPVSERYLSRNSGRVAQSHSRGSADPTPSTFPVKLSQAPADSQTGKSVEQVLKTTGVPPTRKPVDVESSGGPSYLNHGR